MCAKKIENPKNRLRLGNAVSRSTFLLRVFLCMFWDLGFWGWFSTRLAFFLVVQDHSLFKNRFCVNRPQLPS